MASSSSVLSLSDGLQTRVALGQHWPAFVRISFMEKGPFSAATKWLHLPNLSPTSCSVSLSGAQALELLGYFCHTAAAFLKAGVV
jgi:hypothetical protein